MRRVPGCTVDANADRAHPWHERAFKPCGELIGPDETIPRAQLFRSDDTVTKGLLPIRSTAGDPPNGMALAAAIPVTGA
jgi:hypothetical protein